MKKFMTFGITALSALALVACGNNNNSTNSSSTANDSSTKSTSKKASVSSKSSSSKKTAAKSFYDQSSSTSNTSSSSHSSSSRVTSHSTSANKSEILGGNYTSLNGTWTNSHGYKLVFNNGHIVAPTGDNSSETYSLTKPDEYNNVVALAFSPAPAPNGMWIMIAFKNTSVDVDSSTDGTDQSKDRIIMGNNGGATLFATKDDGGIPDTAYYRSN